MGKLPLELAEKPLLGNDELAAMGELMHICDIDSICAKRESLNSQVVEKDILWCRRPYHKTNLISTTCDNSRTAHSSRQPWTLTVCRRKTRCGNVSRR